MDDLRRTPLHDLHASLGAKMVPFAGWDMPVQYPMGVLNEHLHTRAAAGLFDVSHMGQVSLRGEGAARALETLVPADIEGLAPGRQRYGLFTDPEGGILDDLMIANKGDHRILGIQAVGQHVSELSNSFAQMLEMGAVLEDVAGTIHVHPTLGEAFHEASLRALGHAIHI